MKEPFLDFVKLELEPNAMVITCGLPGTCKTGIAYEISKIKDYSILRTDLIRLDVLKNEDIFDVKVAGDMSKRELVYNELFRQAEELISNCKCVILDATFVTQNLRRRAAEIAAKARLPFVIFQTSCSEEASLCRILRRNKKKSVSNALSRVAYIANKKKFEPVDLDGLKQSYPNLGITHLIVDTEQDNVENWYILSKTVR